MNMCKPVPRKQQGSMLLEALISILIFSIAILAIIGLQAASIKMSSEAKYRSDASILANQHLALMWSDLATAITSQTAGVPTPFDPGEFIGYASGGTFFMTWNNTLAATLPNASAVVATNTVLTCDNAACPAVPVSVLQTTATDVTITISWNLPDCVASNPNYPACIHRYQTTAMLAAQKQL